MILDKMAGDVVQLEFIGRYTSSKSLLIVLRKWSDGLLRCGHGKPFRVKNCARHQFKSAAYNLQFNSEASSNH